MHKYMALGSFLFLIASTASAQTAGAATTQPNTQTTASPNSAQTVTMTGCVGAMSSTGGFLLSNPMTVPSSAQPGTPTASVATTPSATQPTGTAGTAGVGTAGTAGVGSAPGTQGTAGTAGTAGSVGTAGATGTVGTPGTSGAASTAGTPGSSALSGYRLSGTDMTSWSGQRVQIVGVVIPGATKSTGSAAGGTGTTLPEFRVQSVTPVTGGCPRQ